MGVDPRWADELIRKGAVARGVNRDALVPTVGTSPAAVEAQARLVAALGDKEFTAAVIAEAQLRGWLVAHFLATRNVRDDGTVYHRTAVQGDGAGFPDLELLRERVVKVELKTGKGRVEPAQRKWLDAYARAGVEWYVWRPTDWPTIVEVLK